MDIICSQKWMVFRERSLRKTIHFSEQIMSKDKYMWLGIFSPQMEVTVMCLLSFKYFSQHS